MPAATRPAGFIVRAPRPDEAEQIADLIRACDTADTGEPDWDVDETRGDWSRLAMCLMSADGAEGWVRQLAVDSRYRGRGLGQALLHAFREFYRRGATRSWLGVDANNPSATKLYLEVGMYSLQEYVHNMRGRRRAACRAGYQMTPQFFFGILRREASIVVTSRPGPY